MRVLRRRKKPLKILTVLCVVLFIYYFLIYRFEPQEPQEQSTQTYGNPLMPQRYANDSQLYIVANPILEVFQTERNKMETSQAHRVVINGDNMKPQEVPMMIEYCNSPHKGITGTEGQVAKGFTLKMVHVFIRHGDRTSIHSIPGYQSEEYNCHFETWYTGPNEHIMNFANHMEQFMGKQPRYSHFLNWAPFPNKKQCGNSDLTSQGALQHIHTGKYLYEKYAKNSGLFDKGLSLNNQIKTISTEVSRTYQSAMALLYGLIPGFNITNLKIESSSSIYFCTAKNSLQKSCFCKSAQHLRNRSQRYRSSINANSRQYKLIKEAVADIFDIKIDRLPWLSALMDAFAPPICHNFSAPCSDMDSGKCVNGSIYKAIWNDITASDLAHSNDPDRYFLKFSSIMLHPVMVEICHRMRDALEGRLPDKFILYSGHDTTLSPLLMLLGLHDGKWPPYASRIVIELYESDVRLENSRGRHYIRFIYNGVDKTDSVLFCKGQTFLGMCTLKLFYDFVFKEMLHRFGYNSYNDACSR